MGVSYSPRGILGRIDRIETELKWLRRAVEDAIGSDGQ